MSVGVNPITGERRDWERHREQVRLANRARYQATKRLQKMYPSVWVRVYGEECAKLGVSAKAAQVEEIRRLQREIEALEAKIEEVT